MKFKSIILCVLLACTIALTGCAPADENDNGKESNIINSDSQVNLNYNGSGDNYRTYYQIFLSSFYDSNGDGIGDFNGLTKKLDYLNDGKGGGLGVTGIWLNPIMPSPSYHKYDCADYFNVDSSFGTLSDFKNLVSECHKRGIKIIIDFVMNHTSTKNPWFESAENTIEANPDKPAENKYLKYYNFVKGTPPTSHYTEIGNTGWYYESEFDPAMPDLNLDDKDLRGELSKSAKFWLDMGVDGFRLDAVKYFYGSKEQSDTDKNISFVNWFADTCKAVNPNTYLVGEVWDNETTICPYYKSSASSFFNFPFAQKNGIIESTVDNDGSNYYYTAQNFAAEMKNWQDEILSENKNAIDAPFISNHDIDRPAGYYTDTARLKMAAGMYMMMSGNAFVYYGEELGMTGSGKDENKRGPMYWSATVKKGMTVGPSGMDTPVYSYPSEDVQIKDKSSILNYYKSAIKLRNEYPEIERGTISVVNGIADKKVCAVKKTYKGSSIIIVYNISESQKTLTLSKKDNGYKGICGFLSPDGTPPVESGENLKLPPMSITVLK